MNPAHDTSGSDNHASDRRYLSWLRTATSAELRAMRATHARTYCPQWEATALEREMQRRRVEGRVAQ